MSVLFMMPNWAAPSEVWLQRMLEELGDELGVLVSWNTSGEKYWRNRARAVSLHQLPSFPERVLRRFGIRLNNRSAEKILLREIQRSEITHILCHYGTFATRFMNVWRSSNKPLFVHFHGYDATFGIRKHSQPDNLFFSDTYLKDVRELAERATLIANSEFTKSLLTSQDIPENRIYVKYLGVPVLTEGKMHSNRDTIRILHLGRLVDFKSPDRTIKAFEIFRSKGMNGHLTIAGDGELRVLCELLRMRSPYKHSIQILGAVTPEHAQALLAEHDIFTQHNMCGELSRQQECFGVSVVEAMAVGLPVVGTRSGGVLETIVEGETGILVAPEDVEAQAEAFIRLAENPALRQQYGDAGRKRVAELFSIEKEAIRLRSIMQLPVYSRIFDEF